MKQVPRKPLKHVFVCVNEREEPRACCSRVGGMNIYDKLKLFVSQKGLVGTVWITKVKCLGFCNNVGTTLVIYPEQEFYMEVKEEDLDQIYNKLLE